MDEKTARKTLQDLKQRLLEDLERGAEASETVVLEQTKVGRLSRMDAMQQQEMHKASQEATRLRLSQIEHALVSLNDGNYGYCELCGEEISPERLAVRPESVMCVPCKEKADNQNN